MKYDGFIFDLDGTLVYTPFEFRYLILNRTLESFGKNLDKEEDRDSINAFWFSNGRDGVIQKRFGVSPADFWKEYRVHDTVDFRRRYSELYNDFSFVMGIRKIGKKTGIVTGAPVHIVDFYLDELMGRDLFDSVTFARRSMGMEKKPSPQALLACIDELGLRKRDVIYTGNSEEDVEMGRTAGVKTVLICRGEWEIDERPGPPARIRSLFELDEFI